MNKYQINKTAPETLVIHCADSRFQDAFRKFITKELRIENYIPLVVGGGVGAFIKNDSNAYNPQILTDQIELFINKLKIKQVCLFNHQDCLWYKDVMNCEQDKIIIKQHSDLKNLANFIKSNFKEIEVKSFWTILKDEQILFKEL